MSESYDVIVIGGGASGMMAAGTAASRGRQVLLLEKNSRLGAKLAITGGGRCNIMNMEPDTRALLGQYGEAGDFLFSPFSQFGVNEAWDFFESRGLPLIVESLKRTFPLSQRASDVVRFFEQYTSDNGVAVKLNTRVKNITVDNGIAKSVITDQGEFFANSIILATGGMSHPETGSTGDGFEFMRHLGHTIVQPTPTIVPLAVNESWIPLLAGVTLGDAKMTWYCNGKKQFTKRGSMLFTHFGISGPTVLNSAHMVGDLLHEGPVTVSINMYPEMDTGSIEKHILAIFDANKNKTLKTIIRHILPLTNASVWAHLFPLLGANPEMLETKVHSISREDRKKLVALASAFPLTISHLMGFDRAVVADGGVTLSEIDTKTMRSRIISNLFITGDLLHIRRPSGGFSLQLCWTSGYIAGVNA